MNQRNKDVPCSRRRLSRRSLLRRAAAAGLAAPFLSGLFAQEGAADSGSGPLRFFLVFTGNGQPASQWLPDGGETDFTLSPVLAPLAGHREKLLLLHGLSGTGGHSGGMSETTTGRPALNGEGVPTGGPSIDQFFAERWRGDSPLPSLELGVLPAGEASDQVCYSEGGLPIPPIPSALGGFERVFAVANEDPVVAEKRRAQEGSVLDVISTDLEAIRGELGSSSRLLLDEHLAVIRDREEELLAPYIPISCEPPAAPAGTGIGATWEGHNRTVAAAFRCGVTRVASIRVGGWGGIESGGYSDVGIAGSHHSAAHGGGENPGEVLLNINRWHAQQIADLADSLDAMPEGDGTVLDHTVIVWANEMGLGEFNHHSRDNVHITMVGGACAGLAQGRLRHLGGADYQDFLYTLTHLLGETDVASFGDHGDTLLDGIFA